MKDFLIHVGIFILIVWVAQILWVIYVFIRHQRNQSIQTYGYEPLGTIEKIEYTDDGIDISGCLNDLGINLFKHKDKIIHSSIWFDPNWTLKEVSLVPYPIRPEWKITNIDGVETAEIKLPSASNFVVVEND